MQVLDIGANIGAFSVGVAKVFATARVVAIEPVASTFAHLVHNVEENGVQDRVRTVNIGVASGRGTRYASVNWVNPAATQLTEMSNIADVNVTTATTWGLGELVRAHFGESERIDFLKVDCEGCEWDVLRALGEDVGLRGRIRYIAAEVHKDATGAFTEEMKGLIREHLPFWNKEQNYAFSHEELYKIKKIL